MSATASGTADAGHGAALARGTFFNALAFLASNLRGIFTFLVARLLGSVVLGTFGAAWAATDLLSKFGTFGFETSTVAFVARAEGAGDRAGAARIARASLTVGLAASASIALAGFAWIEPIARHFGQRPELAHATAVVVLALPGLALYRISNAASRGLGLMHHDISSRGLTESLGTTAALLIALAFGARRLAPEIAAIAGTLASGCVAFWLARRALSGPRPGPGILPLRELIGDSSAIAAYDFLNIGIMQIDVIMLGLFVGRAPGVTLATLGVYAAGVEIASGLRKITQAFTPIFMPVVARQVRAGRIEEAQTTYAYLARWMLAILLPAVALFAIAGGALMSIYGPAFRIGSVWVAIVATACALNSFVALGETILTVERPRMNLINAAIAFVAAIALNLVLIPRLGPLGAALGMVVPYAVYGGLRAVEISWLFNWRWPWRALVKPTAASLLALPPALLLRVLSDGILIEVAAALVYVAAYFLVWRIIGLEPADRDVLDHLWHRRRDISPTR